MSSGQPINLQTLADYLRLSPATVSLVINRSKVADSIPQETKNRVFAAAKKFNYRPNLVARSLRQQRTLTIGVVAPEISEGYAATVMSGIEDYLLRAGYFYFVASHRHRPDLIEEYPRLFMSRAVEGLIAVDTPWPHAIPIPVVTISGHRRIRNVTNIVLNHERAAHLALEHLAELGHRRIAVIKGQAFSSDTEVRWRAIVKAARQFDLEISPKLTVQMVGDVASPELGYQVTQQILASKGSFTALFAFNDISAIGTIRALREAGLRVPEDVSVVGFDDIQSAAFQNPGLTTVRQPLRKMGELAAETLLARIANRKGKSHPKQIMVEPELVVRGTTGRAASLDRDPESACLSTRGL
ncbi:MAG: LacI family transcriptional regulator [Acidobacteria bacterium]|nr:LacI family transcriptional regulator [Acidobacteriota bacterium]